MNLTNERYAGFERFRARELFAVLLIAIALATSFSLVGCGNEKTSVQSSLEGALATVQQCDESALDDLFGAVWFYPEDYGVSSTCFAEAYFGNLTYTVGDVRVRDDGAATAELTVSAYRMSDVLSTMEAARDEASASGADFSSEGYADAVFATMAEEAIEGVQWASDELSMSVELERMEDGTWVVADEATFAAVLLDGYDPRQMES